MPCSKANGQGI